MVFGGAPIEIEHLLAECKYLTSSLKFSSRSSIEIFDYQRAVAINSYLLGEIDTSKKILLSLLNKLHERKILTKKLWYIGIFLIVTIFMIFLSIYLEHFKYVSFLKIATFGSIGGFISLNLKLQKVKFEVSESTLSYIFVSIYKVVFCMLTSIISYFLIKSDLILGVVQANSNSDFFIYAIATLAGFSESLLPNIFKSIESSTYDNDNKNESKTDINSDNGFGI